MQELDYNRIKQSLRIILLCIVNGFCLGFVIYQTINCAAKYIEKPQVTKVSLKESRELPSSPAITICGQSEQEKFYNSIICNLRIFTRQFFYASRFANKCEHQ